LAYNDLSRWWARRHFYEYFKKFFFLLFLFVFDASEWAIYFFARLSFEARRLCPKRLGRMRRRYFAILFVFALGVSSLTCCEKAEEKAPRLLSDYCSSFFSDSGEYQNGLYIHNPYPDDGSRLNAFQDKDGSFATQLKTLVEGGHILETSGFL
jgi:hypothetical protein